MAFPNIKSTVTALVFLSFVSMLELRRMSTMDAWSSGEGIILIGAAGSRAANQVYKNLILLHAPGMHNQSQLHQNIMRALQLAGATAESFDGKTESADRQGITVFSTAGNSSGHGARFDVQTMFERLRRGGFDYEVWFHVIPVQMPVSNHLRLKVGSYLTTDESDLSIFVTNETDGAFKEDGVVIVNPDVFKNATMAVPGTEVVFNIAKILEAATEEPVNLRGSLEGGFPHIVTIRASKISTNFKYDSVLYILLTYGAVFLIFLVYDILVTCGDGHHHILSAIYARTRDCVASLLQLDDRPPL